MKLFFIFRTTGMATTGATAMRIFLCFALAIFRRFAALGAFVGHIEQVNV